MEEAAAATAAALASRPPVGRPGRPRSDGGYSQDGSPMSTPSPIPRAMSLSPSAGLPPIPNMHRHPTDYSFMSTGSLPVHLSRDMHHASPRSSPVVPTGSITSMPGSHRAATLNTSHPTGYGPPPVLEPPAQHDPRAQGSPHGSPHFSNGGWPTSTHAEHYMYPDPYGSSATAGAHLYYPSSNIRRPQSTEPAVELYDTKPRLGEVWTTPVS